MMTRISMLNRVCVVVALLVVAAWAGPQNRASAAFLTDYFNGYGATNADLNTKGAAGSGWAGGWTGTAEPDYQANNQLTYGGVGYSNAGNNSAGTDGRAHFGGGNSNSLATRNFSTGMNGTVWVSWLTSNEGNNLYAAQLSFDGSFNNYFRILDSASGGGVIGNRQGVFNGVVVNPSLVDMPAYTDNTTGLLLAKIDMNYSGALDRITMWLNPNLTSGLGSIGSGFVLGSGVDVFGPTLDSVSVSFSRSFGAIDAIRVSNDADGFFDVTGFVEAPLPAPEPSTALMASLGVCLLSLRRRGKVAANSVC